MAAQSTVASQPPQEHTCRGIVQGCFMDARRVLRISARAGGPQWPCILFFSGTSLGYTPREEDCASHNHPNRSQLISANPRTWQGNGNAPAFLPRRPGRDSIPVPDILRRHALILTPISRPADAPRPCISCSHFFLGSREEHVIEAWLACFQDVSADKMKTKVEIRDMNSVAIDRRGVKRNMPNCHRHKSQLEPRANHFTV